MIPFRCRDAFTLSISFRFFFLFLSDFLLVLGDVGTRGSGGAETGGGVCEMGCEMGCEWGEKGWTDEALFFSPAGELGVGGGERKERKVWVLVVASTQLTSCEVGFFLRGAEGRKTKR